MKSLGCGDLIHIWCNGLLGDVTNRWTYSAELANDSTTVGECRSSIGTSSMTTKTPTESPHSRQTDDLAASDIFPLLASDRRRNVLHYLTQQVGSVSLGELAEQIAIWEDDPTFDQYGRILTSLHHTHLPSLVDGGLVRYDSDEETVAGRDAMQSVRPYLDLALHDDH